MKHPMQKIIRDKHDALRFETNAIVEALLEHGPFDMNSLARMDFSDEDRAQFAQLIGYSVSGFCGLSYVSEEIADAATAASLGDEFIDGLTKDQRGLLLYAETICVDWSGLLEDIRMNAADTVSLKFWQDIGALTFGRVPAAFLKSTGRICTRWVTMTPKGWEIAAKLRQKRAANTGTVRKAIDADIAERNTYIDV